MNVKDAMNRLGKWRNVLASWQCGTFPRGYGPGDAVKDHREATLALRAEVTALVTLLVDKGVIQAEEFAAALAKEAELLCADYEAKFPGMTATDNGINMKMPQAAETMKRMGFPP